MEHMLASRITKWCMGRSEMSQEQAEAVTYGIELIFNSVFKVVVLVLIGLIFHRADEVIIGLGCFSLLRSFAGGVHKETNMGCFLSMLLICVVSSLGAQFITYLPIWLMIIIAIAVLVLIKLFAPFVTENNPIEDPEILKKKKRGAFILSAVLLLAVFIIPIWRIKMLILIPVIIETATILPCWHKNSKTIG